MSMNTPIGQITRTSPIKNFTELSKVELEQYLLGINNISQGDGSKITLQNLITSMVSEDIENLLEIGNDGKLAVKSNALTNDTGWVTPPTLTVNWENKTVNGAGGQFMQGGVVVDLLSEFTTSGFDEGNGNYYLYYNSASRELEWSKGYPTVNKDYINHICEIVIMETGSFAIQTWGFGGISKDLINYLNNVIGMTVLAGGIIDGVEIGNAEKRKPTISQTKIGTANFNQTFVATQTGETYTQAHASGDTIVFEAGKTEIVPVGVTGMAQYLSDSGLTDLEADKYMNVWLFALPTASTSPENMSYLYITGSGRYDDLESAKAANFSKDKTIKVLSEKFYRYCPIARFTIKNSEGNFSIADYGNISSISASSSSSGSLSGGGSGLQMFDTILKDHVLTYEESKGLALQGTYVYKTAIAGSRYGYPDFYAKCLEEYNQATTTETVNGVTVKVHSNGHKFYNIADKSAIDSFFNTMGSAWFYGIDTENERVFLPRNNYFSIEGVASSVPVVGNGMTLGFTDGAGNNKGSIVASGQISLVPNSYGSSLPSRGSDSGLYPNLTNVGITTDPTKSGIEAITSKVLKFNENKYLYICVGNTTNYEGMTDVVNQGMEILEQVNQGIESRVALDGSNAQFPFISETYVNGTSWYRIYSDGWCEQGGLVSSGSGASTVTLLKSYVNTNYNCQVTSDPMDGHPNPQLWTRVVTAKTTTSFTTNQYNDFFAGYEWRTAGYIR